MLCGINIKIIHNWHNLSNGPVACSGFKRLLNTLVKPEIYDLFQQPQVQLLKLITAPVAFLK
jgi:hypothetical protein